MSCGGSSKSKSESVKVRAAEALESGCMLLEGRTPPYQVKERNEGAIVPRVAPGLFMASGMGGISALRIQENWVKRYNKRSDKGAFENVVT